ncbi:hypothetical protein SD81_011190 [Tolypothrix campylonemoides VB511288]|nr:hypothetical protein SD81_011190 [Tolypothrix campylonemoides VB511288]
MPKELAQYGVREYAQSNWNAADALPWYLAYFGSPINYIGLLDGFEAIPFKCDEFVKAIARSALPFGQSVLSRSYHA